MKFLAARLNWNKGHCFFFLKSIYFSSPHLQPTFSSALQVYENQKSVTPSHGTFLSPREPRPRPCRNPGGFFPRPVSFVGLQMAFKNSRFPVQQCRLPQMQNTRQSVNNKKVEHTRVHTHTRLDAAGGNRSSLDLVGGAGETN